MSFSKIQSSVNGWCQLSSQLRTISNQTQNSGEKLVQASKGIQRILCAVNRLKGQFSLINTSTKDLLTKLAELIEKIQKENQITVFSENQLKIIDRRFDLALEDFQQLLKDESLYNSCKIAEESLGQLDIVNNFNEFSGMYTRRQELSKEKAEVNEFISTLTMLITEIQEDLRKTKDEISQLQGQNKVDEAKIKQLSQESLRMQQQLKLQLQELQDLHTLAQQLAQQLELFGNFKANKVQLEQKFHLCYLIHESDMTKDRIRFPLERYTNQVINTSSLKKKYKEEIQEGLSYSSQHKGDIHSLINVRYTSLQCMIRETSIQESLSDECYLFNRGGPSKIKLYGFLDHIYNMLSHCKGFTNVLILLLHDEIIDIDNCEKCLFKMKKSDENFICIGINMNKDCKKLDKQLEQLVAKGNGIEGTIKDYDGEKIQLMYSSHHNNALVQALTQINRIKEKYFNKKHESNHYESDAIKQNNQKILKQQELTKATQSKILEIENSVKELSSSLISNGNLIKNLEELAEKIQQDYTQHQGLKLVPQNRLLQIQEELQMNAKAISQQERDQEAQIQLQFKINHIKDNPVTLLEQLLRQFNQDLQEIKTNIHESYEKMRVKEIDEADQDKEAEQMVTYLTEQMDRIDDISHQVRQFVDLNLNGVI